MTNTEKLSISGKELKVILRILIDDVTITLKMIKKNDKPFWRRTLVRSLFASIEGINHRMKFVALELALTGLNSVKLSPAEVALLREELYELNDKGDTIKKRIRLELLRIYSSL